MKSLSLQGCKLAIALSAVALAVLVTSAPAQAAGPFQYHALTPCRIFDTRTVTSQTNGSPLTNPGPYNYRVQGNCGVPNGAAAVSANFTVVTPTRPGDVRAFPVGSGTPSTSTVNYPGGASVTVANGALTPLATVAVSTDKDLEIVIGMAAAGSIHLIMDVTGYFE